MSYADRAIVGKAEDDGSKQVLSWLKRKNIVPIHFHVCGVNTSACVFSTVMGLSQKNVCPITVHAKGCNGESFHFWGLFQMTKLHQTTVVPTPADPGGLGPGEESELSDDERCEESVSTEV